MRIVGIILLFYNSIYNVVLYLTLKFFFFVIHPTYMRKTRYLLFKDSNEMASHRRTYIYEYIFVFSKFFSNATRPIVFLSGKSICVCFHQ